MNNVRNSREAPEIEQVSLIRGIGCARGEKNAGRGFSAAGIARKWEGERRGVAPDYRARTAPVRPQIAVHHEPFNLLRWPDPIDLRFAQRRGKWNLKKAAGSP